MKEDKNNQLNLNQLPQKSVYQKAKDFLDNIKKAVKDTFTTTGIAVSTLIPSSVESLTTIAPTVTLPTAAALITACEHPDITPPTINISKPTLDISGGEQVRISGSQLYIGNNLVASRSDDISSNCMVSITMNGKPISSSTKINEAGTINIKVTDEAGNTKNASVKVNILNPAPNIDLKRSEVDISKPKVVTIEGNKLLIGGETIATWSDDKTQNCKVSLTLDGKEIKSGDTLKNTGTLVLTITNGEGKSSSVNITLNIVNNAPEISLKQSQINIYGETKITISDNKLLLGDQEIASRRDDRTENCTVSIKFNNKGINSGSKINESGTLSITVSDGEGKTSTKEISIVKENIEYQAVSIKNIKPVEILPMIGQVEAGDKNFYDHIEHLRIAEATRVIDMMRKYGAGTHSPEQYQQLMGRLNTGMLGENPVGYSNYQSIGGAVSHNPSNHAGAERFTLTNIVKHANFIIIDQPKHGELLYNLSKSDPTKINIMGLSKGSFVNKNQYDAWNTEISKEYDKQKNSLVFCALGNIGYEEGYLINKVCQADYSLPDVHSAYGVPSRAHNKTDKILNRHFVITASTDAKGDIDQTNEQVESSVFPMWLHDKILFSGRTFAFRINPNEILEAFTGKYSTSHANYVNVVMADLCFQMFAEVEDVDELLEMIRSTALTDYIRFDLNGDGDTNDTINDQPETQPLQLMNPAGFFKKYLMPKDIPSSIQPGETIALNKGYYKGVLFAIPGAEVKINGEWIEYNKANESLIKSQNPMNLERRLNGDLVAKYNKDGLVTGKIIAVDDQRNGLNLDKENIKINIQNAANIVSIQNIAGVTCIGIGDTIMLTTLSNQGPVYDIPSSIHPGETIMLTNSSNQRVIYDIPGAQMYIKGKWISYNNQNKALIQSQDLKNSYWRLNGNIANKSTRKGYVKGKVFTVDDKGDIIHKRKVFVNIENDMRNNNGYIAQGYNKNEGHYQKSEKGYTKNEGKYQRSGQGYTKNEGNYTKYTA